MAMATTSSPSRVLLVDDDPSFLRTLQILLEDDGAYRVETACAGEEALRRLDEDPEIKVLVTDLSMPGMDGMRLLQEVKNRRGDLPVILMTAHRGALDLREAQAAGAFDFLSKPIDPDRLLEVIAGAARSASPASEE